LALRWCNSSGLEIKSKRLPVKKLFNEEALDLFLHRFKPIHPFVLYEKAWSFAKLVVEVWYILLTTFCIKNE